MRPSEYEGFAHLAHLAGEDLLRAHIASIKGAGQGGILRSLNDRPAILKHSEFVGIKMAPDQVGVAMDGAELSKTFFEILQIELARFARVDLH